MTMDELFIKPCPLEGRLLQRVSLARYTSWRAGGEAAFAYQPAHLNDLALFLKHLRPTIPLLWLGLGSNILIRDQGVDGVVIMTQGALNQLDSLSTGHVRAEVGISSAQLARYTARAGFGGLEFMAGIPGTVGGALAMNAGCNGSETWNFVKTVQMMNRFGEIRTYAAEDFEVGYRHVQRPAEAWFVSAEFALKKSDKTIALQCIRDLLEKRAATQPMGTINCGSVFRNPPGHYAGKLIESCGLKGKTHGGAMVSKKHANFILNANHASALDIENLIMEVRTVVQQKTGILLIPEVCIIGQQ